MRHLNRIIHALALTTCALLVTAQQFVNNGANHWYTQTGTEGVTIGTNVANAPSALTILGNNMNTPTDEVFLTDAPGGHPNELAPVQWWH